MKKTCLIAPFVWLLVCVVLAQAQTRKEPIPLLAITDLRTIGDESSLAEARAFSDFIRQEIEKTGKYRVLSRSSMLSILKAESFPLPCHELNCFVQLGRLVDADLVLAGFIQRQGEFLEVTLRVIDASASRFKKNIYRNAPNIPSDQLIGEWGLNIIYETFDIDKNQLNQPEEEAGSAPPVIPDAIKLKYPGMVYIHAGEAIIGSNNGDTAEMPPHAVYVEAFYINQHEVTNKEFADFIQTTGYRTPEHWPGGVIPEGMLNHPVCAISYEDAEQYCQWKGGRLPTEEEWERAARGQGGQIFPWGNTFESKRANTWEADRAGTAPIGSYPQGASPFGVEDMAGNVFEWVSGFFVPYPGAKIRLIEYDKHLRVLKGGSWKFNDYYARTSHRYARSGGERDSSFGFRMARDAE